MKIQKYQNKEDWFAGRRGKITGSRVGDVLTFKGDTKKIGFYELIAERLGIPADDESAMARGQRLEPEAIDMFVTETKKKVNTDLVIWSRDEDENIAISPDGYVEKGKVAVEAVECKCLSSARHIEAFLTQKVPNEFKYQMLQYFIVNDDLKKLYFAFYDPRLLAKPFFILTVERKEVSEEVGVLLGMQRKTLEEVDNAVNQLTY